MFIRLRRPGTRRRPLTGAAAAALVVVSVTSVIPVSATASATHQHADGGGGGASSAATVPAPGGGPGATVSVSQTSNLVNQTVEVTWSGFRPSSDTRLANAGDSLDVNTERPVRVYQCRGADPASSSDCYGSPGFRGLDATNTAEAVPPVPAFTYPGQTDPYAATPDGPANWQDNVTRADGTGEVSIQLFTKRESAALGCDAGAPCSIVVVPNYGRPAGATEDKMDAPWAWANRTVVPLEFLPVGDACPLTGTTLRVEGSPVAAGVLASWRARTCTLSSHSVTVDYTAIGEPQTRTDVASTTTNMGLTIEPLPTADARSAGIVYAPVAVTALVVAFQIDDADGKPITHLNLNARLVAKLVTGSYRSGGNPAVATNPVNIFHDPELWKLNPGVTFPSGSPGNHPLILGDMSDTTVALTRWLASDKDAAAFLHGKADPWGMTVNQNYRDVELPFSSFPLLDELLSDTYAPVQELDALARQLSIAQFPGSFTVVEDGQNVAIKQPRQNPGRREVIGIIDATAAARFRLSTASIQNASGAFVRPTVAAMLAGIQHATVNPDGVTRSVDLTDKDPGVYPLTLLISAASSTKAPQDERDAMVDLLAYVHSDGQIPGNEVGRLPAGNAPLPPALRDLVDKASESLATGYQSPSPSPSDSPTVPVDDGLPSDLPSGTPSDAEPSASASPSTGATVEQPTLVTVGSRLASNRMILLPVLGVLALLSLVVGPLLLWMSHTGRGAAWLRR